MNSDVSFGECVQRILAGWHGWIGQHDDHAGSRQVGHAVDAFGVALLNRDLELVVGEDLR